MSSALKASAEVTQYSFLDSIERLDEEKSDEEDNFEIEEFDPEDEETDSTPSSPQSSRDSYSSDRRKDLSGKDIRSLSISEEDEFRGVSWNSSIRTKVDMVPTTVNDEIQYLAVATVTTKMRQFWVNLLEENESEGKSLTRSGSGSSSRNLSPSPLSPHSLSPLHASEPIAVKKDSKKEKKVGVDHKLSPRTSGMSTLRRLLTSSIEREPISPTKNAALNMTENPLFPKEVQLSNKENSEKGEEKTEIPSSPKSLKMLTKTDKRLSQSSIENIHFDEENSMKIEHRPRSSSVTVLFPPFSHHQESSPPLSKSPPLQIEDDPFELEERRKILAALEISSAEENSQKSPERSPEKPEPPKEIPEIEPFSISSPPKPEKEVLDDFKEFESEEFQQHQQLLAKLSEDLGGPAFPEKPLQESLSGNYLLGSKVPPPIPQRKVSISLKVDESPSSPSFSLDDISPVSSNASSPSISSTRSTGSEGHFLLGNHRGASSTQSSMQLTSPKETSETNGNRGSLPTNLDTTPSGTRRASSFLKRASLRHNKSNLDEEKGPKLKRAASSLLRGKSERKLYTFQEHKLHRIAWDAIRSTIPEDANREDFVVGAPLDGYSLELGCQLGNRKVRTTSRPYDLEDTDKYEHYFRDNFFKKDCFNYIGWSGKKDVMLISISKPEEQQDETTKLMALIRTPEGDARVDIIRQEGKKKEDSKSLKKSIVKELKGAFDHLSKTKLTLIEKPSLSDDLLDFENKQVVSGMKFGILYRKKGQMLEEEMFGNGMDDVSPKFLKFLDWLGDRVQLKGFTGFRGGLDVKTDTTGTHSVHTKYADIELMFHVAPMLPHFKADVQQVEKKRHLGNDIVVIIFNDSNEPYSPHTIKTEFNHVYCIIQPQSDDPKDSFFKVGFASRSGVPPFGPLLPLPSIFQLTQDFRDLLLTKLMNGERAAFTAPQFAMKMSRTRKIMLESIAKQYAK